MFKVVDGFWYFNISFGSLFGNIVVDKLIFKVVFLEGLYDVFVIVFFLEGLFE